MKNNCRVTEINIFDEFNSDAFPQDKRIKQNLEQKIEALYKRI